MMSRSPFSLVSLVILSWMTPAVRAWFGETPVRGPTGYCLAENILNLPTWEKRGTYNYAFGIGHINSIKHWAPSYKFKKMWLQRGSSFDPKAVSTREVPGVGGKASTVVHTIDGKTNPEWQQACTKFYTRAHLVGETGLNLFSGLGCCAACEFSFSHPRGGCKSGLACREVGEGGVRLCVGEGWVRGGLRQAGHVGFLIGPKGLSAAAGLLAKAGVEVGAGAAWAAEEFGLVKAGVKGAGELKMPLPLQVEMKGGQVITKKPLLGSHIEGKPVPGS